MSKAVILIPLAVIAGAASYVMDSGALLPGANAEMNAMLVAMLVLLPVFSDWLEN